MRYPPSRVCGEKILCLCCLCLQNLQILKVDYTDSTCQSLLLYFCMTKRRRFNTDYTIHFVTFTVYRFINIFNEHYSAIKFNKVLRYYIKNRIYRLHASVIMPNHVHLLLERTSDKKISDIVRDIKKYFSYLYKHEIINHTLYDINQFKNQGRYRLWENGFDEVTIYSEKQYYTKLQYIINNPVKAGLVRDSKEYPYLFVLNDY
ncbi:MAG: hypothetical protein DWP97_02330 [Calditrichaeota bacterium]|nr:MAG: hypothetical protein DWP97_02330 [Calditrichota bacterium]